VDARWETWCTICRAWDAPPLPVTPDLVQKVAASLKAAGYKSAAMYFSLARQRHMMQYNSKISPYTNQCIKDYLRSIHRGLGGAQQKRGFVLENLVHISLNIRERRASGRNTRAAGPPIQRTGTA